MLYWFKWEVYIMWLLGFVLFIIVYYFGVSVYFIDLLVNVMLLIMVIFLGLGLIFGGLVLYEFVCCSLLVKYLFVFGIGLVVFVCIVSYLFI